MIHTLAAGALGLVSRGARAHALGDAFEGLARIPRLDLGGLPTAVTSHPRLARELGLVSLHVKRDDRAGSVFGGSKTRKLAFLLADLHESGTRSVLTFGGVGSNHALATAVHGRRLGLRVHLVLLHERPSAHVRTHLLAAHAQGAMLHAGTREDRDDPRRAIARFAPGESPFVIETGGTSPLGNLGYVDAAFELARQVRGGELPEPDVIYLAAGTTGAAAGLALGLGAAGLRARVVGVRASGRGTANRRRAHEEMRRTLALLRERDPRFPAPSPERLHIEHAFAGEGYAVPSQGGRRAIALTRGELTLDSTYTAKAFAALSARAQTEHAGGRVLFWHTFDPRVPAHEGVRAEDLPPRLRAYARAE